MRAALSLSSIPRTHSTRSFVASTFAGEWVRGHPRKLRGIAQYRSEGIMEIGVGRWGNGMLAWCGMEVKQWDSKRRYEGG